MNAWLSLPIRNSQAEPFPTQVRARAVGFVYSGSRFSAIFTGCFIAAILQRSGIPGGFILIAGAMVIVVLSVAIFGPPTKHPALKDISR